MTASVVIVWLGFGLSTGKFDESLAVWIFQSKDACLAQLSSYEEARCIPIATTKEGAEAMIKELSR
jgi:hypothetical protein